MIDEDKIYEVLGQLKQQKNWGKPFAVPVGYFEKLEAVLQKQTEFFEQDEVYSFNTVSKKNAPFGIPDGYFDALPEVLLAKAKQPVPQKAPVISMLTKWVVAASVCLLVVLSVLFFKKNRAPYNEMAVQKLEKGLERVSTDQLNDFLIQGRVDSAANTALLPEKEILHIDQNQFFEKVSTKDLKNYLSETGSDYEDNSLLN